MSTGARDDATVTDPAIGGTVQLRAGPLDGDQLAALVGQVTSVLEAAREVGIVHRDLEPHDLFLTDDGLWKVLDSASRCWATRAGRSRRAA